MSLCCVPPGIMADACYIVIISRVSVDSIHVLQSKQTRMRHSEIKVAIAHVLRLLVSSLPPGALQREALIRNMVLDHISSSYRYLKSVASGAQTGVLAYSLAVRA